MTATLNRRGLLKLGLTAGLGLAFARRPPEDEAPAHPLGRALLSYVTVYARPSARAATVRRVNYDGLIPLLETLTGEDVTSARNRWFRTPGGFVATNNVQPVGLRIHWPPVEVPTTGLLLEVSVPYADARPRPLDDATPRYRYYFGTTHWSYQLFRTDAGRPWYALYDDRLNETLYVRAELMRPLWKDEWSPLSADVPPDDKRIEVDTTKQWLEAFEGDRSVRRVRIASGRRFSAAADYRTPLGEYAIQRKRPSRHMAAGDRAAADSYDLPGVPWVSYFNGGIAFHGTYWHNDYGFSKSHGCINMPTEAAKWLFRWSLPQAGAGERLVEGVGTRVIVR